MGTTGLRNHGAKHGNQVSLLKKKASGDREMKDQGATLLPLLHTTLTVRSQLKLSGSSKERNSKAERHCVLSGGKK